MFMNDFGDPKRDQSSDTAERLLPAAAEVADSHGQICAALRRTSLTAAGLVHSPKAQCNNLSGRILLQGDLELVLHDPATKGLFG